MITASVMKELSACNNLRIVSIGISMFKVNNKTLEQGVKYVQS